MSRNRQEAERCAENARLTGADEKILEHLELSVRSARELGDRLPKDLHWSEELAINFRFDALNQGTRRD